MSEKEKGILNVKGNCDPDCIVGEPSPEKRKTPANGLKSTKEPKTKQSRQQKQQWVLSSFDGFEYSNSQAVPANNRQKSQPRLKKKSSETEKPRIQPDSNVLWCDKYSPLTETVLAVHKKKVSEVRDWLLSHLCLQSGNGVLLLTGPPGSGKTATLRVLARELGVAIQEWVNPLAQSFDNDFNNFEWKNYEGMGHRQSQLKNFQDFFLRANKYPCLSLGASDTEQNKKIILVEDVPNVFYRRASELHDILGSYQKCSRNPVVFVVSDSNSNDTNAYRLFPKDIVQNLGIAHISFNPASVTSLNKLAKEIIWSESKKRSASFQTPSAEVIDALVSGCNGDIRGLINNLQFTCLKGCSTTFQKMKHTKQFRASREKSGKRSSKKSTVETEIPISSTIGGKDTSLFLFRVLGKVLYCKREESSNETEKSLPAHLKQHERLPLVENPESVFERSHMSGENVNLYLHQNYLDFFNNINDVCVASDYLSDADHLTAEWMHRTTLCCYTPSVAIRGLMFCNQGKAVNQTKNVWRPLHKPKWFDVFKQTRQNMSTAVDLFKDHFRNSEQLHCEYLPYLALSDVPLSSPGQINYLQTVCKFSRNVFLFRGNDSTLQEKEMDDSESEMGCSQPQSSQDWLADDKEILHVTQIEEDDNIEEFDDD